jgi:hypothetical protein
VPLQSLQVSRIASSICFSRSKAAADGGAAGLNSTDRRDLSATPIPRGDKADAYFADDSILLKFTFIVPRPTCPCHGAPKYLSVIYCPFSVARSPALSASCSQTKAPLVVAPRTSVGIGHIGM